MVNTGYMNVITIPKKIARKGDLIVISPREYEALVRRQPKVISVAALTARERRAVTRGEKELRGGSYITLEAFEHELGGTAANKH